MAAINQQPNISSIWSACGQLEGTAERKILIPWIRLKFGGVFETPAGLGVGDFLDPKKKTVGSKLVSKLGYFILFGGGLINTKLTGLHHSYGSKLLTQLISFCLTAMSHPVTLGKGVMNGSAQDAEGVAFFLERILPEKRTHDMSFQCQVFCC